MRVLGAAVSAAPFISKKITMHFKPLLLAMVASLCSVAAHAGSCNVTTPGAASCAIPAGVASVHVVATGGGGGGCYFGTGGHGGVVTATLTGVGGTTLSLFVGGGGRAGSAGYGGGASTVNAGTASQIIAGGGGGGGKGGGAAGGNGDGSNGGGGGTIPYNGGTGTVGGGGIGGANGIGGSGGIGSVGNGGAGGNGDGGGGGHDNSYYGGTGGLGSGGGNGGNGVSDSLGSSGGGGGGYGGGGGGGKGDVGGGGGGGGSTGGVVTVASNGGAEISAGGNGSIVITWVDPNTAPSFLGASTLTVAEGASATDVKGLLHVSDVDSGQTETWSQSGAPSHGTLSIAAATANSGTADITPGGSITYTPTAGYAGADSFVVQVSDGTASATKTIHVTVSPSTVTVGALNLNGMTVGRFASQTLTAAGGFGAYTYRVSAGALPAGLTLNASTGALGGTPTAAGAYSFTIQATDSSTGTGPFSGARTFTGTVAAMPPVIPLDVIPRVDNGVTTAVVAKDLSSGEGPSLVACLSDALTEQLGAIATYQGQNTDGGARFSLATKPVQWLSFYPVNASSNSNGSGITLSGTNALTVATRCGTFTTEAALFNRREFGALVAAMGLTANINEQGVITLQSGSTIYVARPDYLVTTGTPGVPSLKQGGDGLWRFTDSAGNVQVLRPAFLEPDVLRASLLANLPGFVSFVVQTDGSGVLTTLVNGANQSSVWTADQTLGSVSADHQADSLWGSGSVWTYRVYAFPRATQGVTAKP